MPHPFSFTSLVLLILVLVPGIGLVRGGARSWIGIGAFSLQPSEFMKLGLIIFLAKYMSNYVEEAKTFKKGVIPLLFFILLCVWNYYVTTRFWKWDGHCCYRIWDAIYLWCA